MKLQPIRINNSSAQPISRKPLMNKPIPSRIHRPHHHHNHQVGFAPTGQAQPQGLPPLSQLPHPTLDTRSGRCKRTKQAFSVAWAAGFVDGEGCICIYRQRYAADLNRKLAYRLGISITQNDLQVLEHFQQGLGIAGNIYEVRRTLQHNRQVYILNFTGINALRVIVAVQPYLVRKRLEAQTAIDYWEQGLCGKRPGRLGWPPSVVATRERFYQKMKSLK